MYRERNLTAWQSKEITWFIEEKMSAIWCTKQNRVMTKRYICKEFREG